MYCCQKFESIFFLSKEWSWTNSWCSHRSSFRVRRDSTRSRNLEPAYLHSFSCCSQFPRKSFPQKNGSSSIWRRDAIGGSMKWRQSTRFPFNLLHSFFSSKQSGDKTICLKGWRLNWPFRARSFCTFTVRGSLHLLKLTSSFITFVNATNSKTQTLNFKIKV